MKNSSQTEVQAPVLLIALHYYHQLNSTVIVQPSLATNFTNVYISLTQFEKGYHYNILL